MNGQDADGGRRKLIKGDQELGTGNRKSADGRGTETKGSRQGAKTQRGRRFRTADDADPPRISADIENKFAIWEFVTLN
jgi:hypothetical protein